MASLPYERDTIVTSDLSGMRWVIAPRDIPSLPESAAALDELARSSRIPPLDLEMQIARDLGLATRVMTVANSPFYGCEGQIDSIRGAITLLGASQIQAIARAMATEPHWDSPWASQLWSHGYACALWTRVITRHLNLPDVPYLFTAGLMHDLGLVLLLRKAPAMADSVIAECRQTGRALVDIERSLLGFNHAEVAARAGEYWKLPERLVRSIAGHHDHDDGDLEASVLMLADLLSQAIGHGAFEWLPRLGRDEIAASVDLNANVAELLEQAPKVRAEVEALRSATSS